MDDINRDAASADHDFDPASAWSEFETALGYHLQVMTPGDCLIVELMGGSCGDGAAPYAQFSAYDEEVTDACLRSELVSNAYLVEPFRLTGKQNAALRALGWKREVGPDHKRLNFVYTRPTSGWREVAAKVVAGLRDVYAIPHPELLTYRAWGPGGDVAEIGLVPTDGVPTDPVPAARSKARRTRLARMAKDRDELVALVRDTLTERVEGDEVLQDADGDFPLDRDGMHVWVRVREEQPAVEIFAPVVLGVRSRRQTAVELAVLNRDHAWVKWVLRDRDIWMEIMLPAAPFAPAHLVGMVDGFFEVLAATRDDLALRTLGKVA